MIPLAILKLVLRFNEAKKDKPEESEETTSASSRVVEEVEDQEASTPKKPEYSPIRSSGYKSFMALSDEALKMWSSALLAKDYRQDAESPDVSFSSLQAMPSGINVPIDLPDSAKGESTSEGTSLWGFLLLGLALAVSRFGLRRKVMEGHETLIAEDYSKPMEAISQLREFREAVIQQGIISGDRIGEVSFPEGTLFDKMQLTGYRITSQYGEARDGYVHRGIDLATPMGTPVRSPFSGYVVYTANDRPKAGNYVEIVSEDGKTGFRFLHLSEILVNPGDKISQGQVIALSGNSYGGAKRKDGSDWGTGAHLHIEAREFSSKPVVGESIFQKGKVVNPMLFGGTISDFTVESNPSSGSMSSMSFVPIKNERAMGTPTVRVSSTSNSEIGIKGKNLMSVTTTPKKSKKDPWVGQIGYTFGVNSLVFPVYQDYATAIRAGAINLGKYQTIYDVSKSGGTYTTIADIAHNAKGHNYVTTSNGDRINDWVRVVSDVSGFAPNEKIDLTDSDVMARMVRGISMVEHSADVNLEDVQNVLRFYKVSNILASNKQ